MNPSRDEALARAATDGTPVYVYFVDEIVERVRSLRAAFGGRIDVSYAVKANPNLALLRALRGGVDQLDVSSGGEVERGLEAGWPAERLSFTGPAKRDAELVRSVEVGVGHHVVESVEEARALEEHAARRGIRVPVLLRITPETAPSGFGLSMAGRPCAFGVDEAEAEAAIEALGELPHLSLHGYHVYAATQGLAAEAVAENLEIALALFERLGTARGRPVERLVVGAGFGIPYHEGEEALDVAAVGARVGPRIDALRAALPGAALSLELGRWLVGEAGAFVTQILRIKESRGTRIGVCDGGMNHHLAAAGHFGSVIRRNYPLWKVGAPDAREHERIDLVGPLCTTIDLLARKAQLPRLQVGDRVAIGCSGAYGRTASPLGFISHPPPREVLAWRAGGAWRLEDVTEMA